MRWAEYPKGCNRNMIADLQNIALLERAPWRGTYYFGFYFYFFGFTRPSHARAHGEARR